MRHYAFGPAHVGERGAEHGLILFVYYDIVAGIERVVIREVKYRAREKDVSIHLRRTIVSRFARVDEMGEVRVRVESEESVEGRGRQTEEVLLEGGKDGGAVIHY